MAKFLGKMKRRISLLFSEFASLIASCRFLPNSFRPAFYRLAGFEVSNGAQIRWGTILRSSRGGRIVIPSSCVMSQGCFIDGAGGVFLGDRVEFGHFVHVYSAGHTIQPSVYRRDWSEMIRQPVRVERGCWIGGRVTILMGVTIAEGCVVAAGALVNKSTEPNGLYAGIPARRIRDLPIETKKPIENGVVLTDWSFPMKTNGPVLE